MRPAVGNKYMRRLGLLHFSSLGQEGRDRRQGVPNQSSLRFLADGEHEL